MIEKSNKTIAVIPAFNEEKTIFQVIQEVKPYLDRIIVIDDGSKDKTAEKAHQAGAEVYRHLLNRGLGAALSTGFKIALRNNPDIIITFDADLQHQAKDIPNLIKPIKEKRADVVIGSRFLKPSSAPFLRFFYNQIANLITFLFFGLLVSDSQSGLRAFSYQALEKIKIQSDKMEVSSEIIGQIKKNKLILKEIPIEPIYTSYSLSKGQNFFQGLTTLFRLFLNLFNRG